MDHPIPAIRPDLVNKNNRTSQEQEDFAVPANHRVKVEESENRINTWSLS